MQVEEIIPYRRCCFRRWRNNRSFIKLYLRKRMDAGAVCIFRPESQGYDIPQERFLFSLTGRDRCSDKPGFLENLGIESFHCANDKLIQSDYVDTIVAGTVVRKP